MTKKDKFQKYAQLIKDVSEKVSSVKGSYCGFDLMNGLDKGDDEDRYDAWIGQLNDLENGRGVTDTERDGVWVPAIPL